MNSRISWSGNLVTFATPRDMWLNEGFTTYVENRIVQGVYGKARAEIEAITDRQELLREFAEADQALQPLAVKAGALKDPDDHLRGTVYTKGAWFLELLEQRFGREVFDSFLRGYFDYFAFRSIDTAEFTEYLTRHLVQRHPGKVTLDEINAWLHQPGVPETARMPVSPRLGAVDAFRKEWLDSGVLPDTAKTRSWSTHEWVYFLEGLAAMGEPLTAAQIGTLDKNFRFTGTGNGEIAQRWYPLTIRSGYAEAPPAIRDFLLRVGRRKLVLPIYRALVKTPEGLAFARELLAESRAALHPITVGSIEAILNKQIRSE